ncbi:Uu.00g058670.m01.CDS01 [Anthostomella pinea]|uniref:Uu.00g058670.m01.CDS01 n=1 Tax=Anthostomella pinea TaxID=933095 RepID=A0AAI8VRX8_9PEZI|nr:Uu.00g058670.m01.CDS01 [Anthostomella pinea]
MAILLRTLATLAAVAGSSHALTHGSSTQQSQAQPSISVSSNSPFSLSVHYGRQTVHNSAILAGNTNSSVTPISASSAGSIANGAGQISATVINPQVARISVNTISGFVGARFTASNSSKFYGVWEYPWYNRLDNAGIEFDFKGLGDSDGINWSNARAPFFLTDDGYGVYADTLAMGSFDFSQPGSAQFVFNTSSLVYYVVLPETTGDYKSLLTAFAGLSNTIEMPPDSGYGPTFWSDDFEEDFHAGVHNAQENYYDVIDHLYYNQIHASSMFADRPYGTGNSSFGNFDFDPVYYPTPKEFIANLSHWGFDFQVWAANRAFLDTKLYNASVANGWLFPNISAEFFQGPALNLSIPEAYSYLKEHMSYFPSVGVKGYKIDRGEEEEMPVWEQNVQMTLFEQLCYETMVEKWGESNFYDFARSAVDRSRVRTAVWNGDSHSNYSGLAYSVTSGIRAGLVGFSQWGSDTGGYIRGLNDPAQELWARWMWFSTFSPVYEIMIGTNHTPWYPPYTSELVDVLKETANMHHDLLPYIRSYTYQAHTTGVPVLRVAFLEAPADAKAWSLVDSYFFGSEFFVAPIVSEGGKRTIYFPEGTKYLEYFNKTAVHQGGSTCEVDLSVHYVPVYVRAGAIVPRGDIFQANNKWTDDWQPELTIELYPSADVPYSSFPYYNGAAKSQVPITMVVDAVSGDVAVEYGAVGVNGTLVVFTKSGMMKATLTAQGGAANFTGVVSLFDD